MNNAAGSPKKRRLNIGPGIVLALGISAIIASQWIRTEIASKRQPSVPPIVERRVVSSSYDERSGPTPEVRFVIDRAAKLYISSAQLTRLRTLQSEWEKFYGPKIAQARQAAAKTRDYLDSVGGKSKTPIPQIENEAAPLVALSREISSARQKYWRQANMVLTAEQREALRKEREADWAAKTRALSKKTGDS